MVFYALSAPQKHSESGRRGPGCDTAGARCFLVNRMRLDYSPAETTALPAARRSFLVAALVLMSVGAAMAHRGAELRNSAVIDLAAALPATPAQADPTALVAPAPSAWVTVKVKTGQTLSSIFDAEGLPTMDWVQIVRLGGDAEKLKRLRAGDELRLRKGPEGVAELTYALDESRTLQVTRVETGFESITLAAEIEHRPTYAMGSLTTSLYESGVASGLPPALIIEMADIFGYDIDFVQDIRVGDRFTVIYEELFKDGEKLRAGRSSPPNS